MDLIDAADVTTRGDSGGTWLGEQYSSRACAVNLVVADACEDGELVLIDGEGNGSLYDTRPIGATATLARPSSCTLPDDDTWLNAGLKDSLELVIGAALVTAPLAGFGAEAIWIGHPDVTESAGDPTDPVDIGKARTLWFKSVFGVGKPILHISPINAPALKVAGVLDITGTGEVVTIWGDDVVMSPAYDIEDSVAFWAPKLDITISSVESTGIVYSGRSNKALTTSSVLALINTPPCTIVRVGDAPAGPPVVGPVKGAAKPGDVFDDPAVVPPGASTGTVAGQLAALGYLPDPTTLPWDTSNDYITVNSRTISWDGTAWTPRVV